ncbi:helix-turn-helix domain-containing protein [Micromonospora yasonensis]|uniref:AraC-like ligand-binding domain-containing protein n=1 Tax=Micromonospora yasonensis TaxID=1128667 RepID=UPI0022316B2B|nr:helix-turn-helix domain-containing protein [Micromonospora yasonensis]MCW3844928.1 helix-turn-helix domain-containing protein [Micromonospora yasonensis]
MFDTSVVPEAERFDLWADFTLGTNPAVIRPESGQPFTAHAQLIPLGDVQLASFQHPSVRLRRTGRHIRQADPELYHLALPIAGRSAISQARNEATIDRARFTFFDTSRPYEAEHRVRSQEPSATICLQIPHARLPLPSATVRRSLAAVMPAEHGLGRLLAQFLRRVADHPDQYAAGDAGRLGNTALDLICTMLARHADAGHALTAETHERVARLRVVEFVERHLADPDLSPAAVAAAQHISLRTLHRLFADDGESVAGLIRRRRLERCRRDLLNPLLVDRPVHTVAACWGFRSSAHFSRAFRAAYGVSPRQLRADADGAELVSAAVAPPPAPR